MSVVAIYNMKGGVGKTTAAVNLSYLSAAGGERVLLWDLDPQAASTFALRVRPRIETFGRKTLESGDAFAAAIKETDYENLDLLPGDFSCRKIDRLLGECDDPATVFADVLSTLGRDYDVVFLDCPPGFSLLTEGILAAADVVLAPVIPTVLSLRTGTRIIKWAERSDTSSPLAAFFSMVDRRKTMHRRTCEWSAGHPEIFLKGYVPYASVVEQMTVRRMPLGAFAAREPAAAAFAAILAELQTRLRRRAKEGAQRPEGSAPLLQAIESLLTRLDSGHATESEIAPQASALGVGSMVKSDVQAAVAAGFIHRFDTDAGDLQRRGYVLELHERAGRLDVVAARSGEAGAIDPSTGAEVQIDSCWAREILSGVTSPLAALERRLGAPKTSLVKTISGIVGGLKLRRIESRVASGAAQESAVRDELLERRRA